MSRGKLTQNGVHLQDHEWKTVDLFLERGKDVELIPKSNIKKYKKPDIMMDGLAWEIKAPKGDGKYTAQNTLQLPLDSLGMSLLTYIAARWQNKGH